MAFEKINEFRSGWSLGHFWCLLGMLIMVFVIGPGHIYIMEGVKAAIAAGARLNLWMLIKQTSTSMAQAMSLMGLGAFLYYHFCVRPGTKIQTEGNILKSRGCIFFCISRLLSFLNIMLYLPSIQILRTQFLLELCHARVIRFPPLVHMLCQDVLVDDTGHRTNTVPYL